MTARVLVVDDLIPNVKLLEAKLRAEYFEVITATSGREALEKAVEFQPDMILLDVMMPEMDGFETCRRLKAGPETCHIPVVMVTALDQQADRVSGLEAGADDFLTKPVEDVALFTRVRSLARLKMMTDELRMRHSTGAELGIVSNAKLAEFDSVESNVLVVDDTGKVEGIISGILPDNYTVIFEDNITNVFDAIRQHRVDLIVVNMDLKDYDPLRLCSTIRTIDETRLTPVLALVREGETRKLVRALDIGVTDYLTCPIDADEMNARVKTQLRRKHYIDQLRSSFHASLELAVIDQLTGLYNRRYLTSHLSSLYNRALANGKSMSVMMIDIDHFKPINDTYGHDAGDRVLHDLARIIVSNVRGMDLACRFGGEEFVVLMPDTNVNLAYMIGERLREEIESFDFELSPDDPKTLKVTVSIGVACTRDDIEDDSGEAILKRADEALYTAKQNGRNCVVNTAAKTA